MAARRWEGHHDQWRPEVPPVKPAWPFLGGATIGAVIVMIAFCLPLFS